MNNLDVSKKRLKRWRTLKIIESGSVCGVTDTLTELVLSDTELPSSIGEVREIFQYLADQQFCAIKKVPHSEKEEWIARILPLGIQFIENRTMEDLGISRPFMES
jgi:hypothetical protein